MGVSLKQTVTIEPDKFGVLVEKDDLADLTNQETDEGRDFFRLPAMWLRDNCKCSECINPDTKQRSFDSFRVPSNIRVLYASANQYGIRVTMSDGHNTFTPWRWIVQAVEPPFGYMHTPDRRLWDSNAWLQGSRPEVTYEECMGHNTDRPIRAMENLMRKIKKFGFCFVNNTPVTPEATEELLERIGPIRNTHYGGFYDFVPDLSSADTAYTNLALDPHTDTTYFSDPAGLQAFHMLSHDAPPGSSAEDGPLGGESILVDGFIVADRIRKFSPELYETLCEVPVAWHASGNADASITPDKLYPVIEREGPSTWPYRIRWNNDDRGVVPLEHADKWYQAARKWALMVQSPKHQYRFQLRPGSVLIFDNWRVLHGRTAFEGLRRICGAYISANTLLTSRGIRRKSGSIRSMEQASSEETSLTEQPADAEPAGEQEHEVFGDADQTQKADEPQKAGGI
ncbi:hypothetical protein ACO1O0_008969 [Amphichorda felina]